MEIFFGLVTEAHDDVGGDGDISVECSDTIDEDAKLLGGVASEHFFENSIRPRLEGHMDMGAHLGMRLVQVQEFVTIKCRIG